MKINRIVILALLCLGAVGAPAQEVTTTSQYQRLLDQLQRQVEALKPAAERAQKDMTAAAQSVTSQTRALLEMPAMLREIRAELQALRAEVRGLAAQSRKPGPEKVYKLELELTLGGGRKPVRNTLNFTDEFMLSASVPPAENAGKNPPPGEHENIQGKYEIDGKLRSAEAGRIDLELKVNMDLVVTKMRVDNSGHILVNGRNSAQNSMKGLASLKPGEAREVMRVNEAALRLTVTPE